MKYFNQLVGTIWVGSRLGMDVYVFAQARVGTSMTRSTGVNDGSFKNLRTRGKLWGRELTVLAGTWKNMLQVVLQRISRRNRRLAACLACHTGTVFFSAVSPVSCTEKVPSPSRIFLGKKRQPKNNQWCSANDAYTGCQEFPLWKWDFPFLSLFMQWSENSWILFSRDAEMVDKKQ